MFRFCTKFFNKNLGASQLYTAFTLAEILITLAIIGIIAAITIPSLINKIEEVQYFSAFKKFYSEFLKANEFIKMDNNGTLSGGIGTSSDEMLTTYGSNFTYVKKCLEDEGGCWHSGTTTWHTLNGGDGWEDRGNNSSAILKDGTYIMFFLTDPTCSGDGWWGSVHNFCGWMSFDTNGEKAPNKMGVDIFDLYLTKDGVGLRGSNDNVTNWNLYCSASSTDTYNGISCPAKIMSANGMDYLN